MNNIQVMETLHKILNDLHYALDELDDVQGNEVAKTKTETIIFNASIALDHLIDDLDDEAHLDGTKSGAV